MKLINIHECGHYEGKEKSDVDKFTFYDVSAGCISIYSRNVSRHLVYVDGNFLCALALGVERTFFRKSYFGSHFRSQTSLSLPADDDDDDSNSCTVIGLKRSDVIDLISSLIKFINVEFCMFSFMSENKSEKVSVFLNSPQIHSY